jgi:hypothetical protein
MFGCIIFVYYIYLHKGVLKVKKACKRLLVTGLLATLVFAGGYVGNKVADEGESATSVTTYSIVSDPGGGQGH